MLNLSTQDAVLGTGCRRRIGNDWPHDAQKLDQFRLRCAVKRLEFDWYELARRPQNLQSVNEAKTVIGSCFPILIRKSVNRLAWVCQNRNSARWRCAGYNQ